METVFAKVAPSQAQQALLSTEATCGSCLCAQMGPSRALNSSILQGTETSEDSAQRREDLRML